MPKLTQTDTPGTLNFIKYAERIYDKDGNIIRRSRNLAGIIRYSANRIIDAVRIDPNRDTQRDKAWDTGNLRVEFTDGSYYQTKFASYQCLKEWTANRRNWYGAPLFVNGIDAGKLTRKNSALIN